MGQNSFSDTITTTANGQGPTGTAPRKKIPLKSIIIFIVAALVGAGIATFIFLVLINRPSGETGPTSPIQNASQDNNDTESKENTVKNFDDKISASTDETEVLSLKLNKVDYYQIDNEYDKALETLSTIDIDSLDSDDKYRVYTYYASTYEGKGDTAQAEHYKDLADDILSQTYPD